MEADVTELDGAWPQSAEPARTRPGAVAPGLFIAPPRSGGPRYPSWVRTAPAG
jgi:hypothetical protein